jgi:transcriptional regulator with XRE-family HTH domain
MPKKKNPLDLEVSHRVRAQRLARGMSQEALGKALGVTFQQVQKYEKGTNRMSVGRLMHIAEVLNVSVYSLLGEGSDAKGSAADGDAFEYLAQPGAVRLLRAYGQLTNRELKKNIIELCENVLRDSKDEGAAR